MEGQAGLSELSVILQVSTVHKHLSYAQTDTSVIDTSVIYTNAKTNVCSDTAIPYHLSLSFQETEDARYCECSGASRRLSEQGDGSDWSEDMPRRPRDRCAVT